MDLYKDYLGNVGFIQIINRGTAEFLEENQDGIFIHDTISDAYMLTTSDIPLGIEWLKKHENRGYEIMTLYQDEIVDFVKAHYNVQEEIRCYQGAWTKPKAPPQKGILEFRKATESDKPFLSTYYDDWTDEHGSKIIEMGDLFIAMIPKTAKESAGKEIGFIGMHPEGATGLLFVLPEFRNRGFAEEMEAFMCERTLSQGLISFGHVKVGNEISMNLQKKVGVEFWDGKLSWLFIENNSN